MTFDDSVHQKYKGWRFRITYSVLFGYAAFYLVRNNVNIAAPAMLKEFHLTKTQMGWVFTLFSILYGFAKFTSGTLCDRLGVRYLMPIGLLGAAAASLLMGGCTSIVPFAIIYALSALFQSTGWPSLSRAMTQWFTGKQLGTRWGIANGSCQIGNTLVLVGGPLLLAYTQSWRAVFLVPGALCLIVAVILFERLRDNPESLRLPPVEEYDHIAAKAKDAHAGKQSVGAILKRYIFPNSALWFMSFAVFFIYLVLKGFFNWAPTFIQETRGVSLMCAGAQTAVGEVCGFCAGMLLGWASGRLFSGRRAILCGIVLIVLSGMILAFKYCVMELGIMWVDTVMWGMIGFLAYGAQVLSGLISAELGFRKAAATAAGFSGIFGYMGSSAAGVGVGYIVDRWSWNEVLVFFSICAFLSGICCFISEMCYKRIMHRGGL